MNIYGESRTFTPTLLHPQGDSLRSPRGRGGKSAAQAYEY